MLGIISLIKHGGPKIMKITFSIVAIATLVLSLETFGSTTPAFAQRGADCLNRCQDWCATNQPKNVKKCVASCRQKYNVGSCVH